MHSDYSRQGALVYVLRPEQGGVEQIAQASNNGWAAVILEARQATEADQPGTVAGVVPDA